MKTNDKTKTEINYEIVILVGLALIIIAPIVFTSAARLKIFNFTETGPIGDTIGGITAPFVGILGAVLVYISFREQQKANRIQWKALKKENKKNKKQSNFEFLYNFFLNEIKNYSFPDNYNFSQCINKLNGPIEGYEQKSRFLAYDSHAKIITNYLILNNSFLFELTHSKLNENSKNAIVNIYLNYTTKNCSDRTINSNKAQINYFNEVFPEFLYNLNRFNQYIDQLEQIKRDHQNRIKMNDLVNQNS